MAEQIKNEATSSVKKCAMDDDEPVHESDFFNDSIEPLLWPRAPSYRDPVFQVSYLRWLYGSFSLTHFICNVEGSYERMGLSQILSDKHFS